MSSKSHSLPGGSTAVFPPPLLSTLPSAQTHSDPDSLSEEDEKVILVKPGKSS